MSGVNNNKREWLKAEIDELIDLYHAKPELWDVKSKFYRDRVRKQNALIEISGKFNTTLEEITRKIHNLRNQFNSELKKSTKRKIGECTDKLYISKWPYFNSLMFLQGGSLCRSAVRNITTHDVENTEIEVQLEPQDILFDENSPTGWNGTEQKNEINRKWLKKNGAVQQNDFTDKTLRALDVKEDQYDVFAKYIATEMRNLSSEYLRRKMKRKFQEIMLEINEEELLSFSVSNDTTSANNAYSNPSSVASCSGHTSLSDQSSNLNQIGMRQTLASYLHNETESLNYESL